MSRARRRMGMCYETTREVVPGDKALSFVDTHLLSAIAQRRVVPRSQRGRP